MFACCRGSRLDAARQGDWDAEYKPQLRVANAAHNMDIKGVSEPRSKDPAHAAASTPLDRV